jgi:hypothetical protein
MKLEELLHWSTLPMLQFSTTKLAGVLKNQWLSRALKILTPKKSSKCRWDFSP